MNFENSMTRREFLRYAMVGGIAVPALSGILLPGSAQASTGSSEGIRLLSDMEDMSDEMKKHFPKVTMPPVVEDGSQAPILVEMDHPMDEDNYIKSIQILSFGDPVVIKGKFYFTPANGEAYISSQIRLASGNSTVWVIAECNNHGQYAVSNTVKVAAGGC